MIKTILQHEVSDRPARNVWFWVALFVLLIFHAVGFWGLIYSGRPMYFQELTPLNLLLTNILLFSLHRGWNASFIVFAVVAVIVGFMAEVVGVHTGLLFGSYSYGATLGLKLWQVPLLIGLNWLMLVYTTGTIANRLPLNKWLKAGVGASLMVLFDLFLEPVAVVFDFWSWTGNQIPLSNFIGWFIVAFLLHLHYQFAHFTKHNQLGPFVYLVQLFFFIGLYLLI